MASLRSVLILPAALPLAITVGCSNTPETSHSWISPGAMNAPFQDANYEIKGKPEEEVGAQGGYGGPGGEVNPLAAEGDAIAPQIHYHYHVHNHHHSNGVIHTVPGYAHASYMVPHHSAMPAYSSPYAGFPNGGNPVGPQGIGPWNAHTGPGHYGPYGAYGAWGGFNPWINGGSGGEQGLGVGGE
jgi:hypothetical protein